MTPDQRYDRWKEWLEPILYDVMNTLFARRVFYDVREMVKANPEIQKESYFFDLLSEGYVTGTIMAIRRQVKSNSDSISLRRLLEEIAEHPTVASRKRYTAMYVGNIMRDQADNHFDVFAPNGRAEVDPSLVLADLKRLRDAGSVVEKYADRRIAHFDKRPPDQSPTWNDLDSALEVIESTSIKYNRLLTGGSFNTLEPVAQSNWKAIFYSPWIPKRVHPPNPLIAVEKV